MRDFVILLYRNVGIEKKIKKLAELLNFYRGRDGKTKTQKKPIYYKRIKIPAQKFELDIQKQTKNKHLYLLSR